MTKRVSGLKVLAAGFALFFILVAASAAFSGEFWGSAKSDVYHYPDCRYARKITPIYLIKFPSPEEARDVGYRPCKVCKPPYGSSGGEE